MTSEFRTPLGLVLVGGGAHGAWQAAVLDQLERKHHLEFDHILCFSIGSLTGTAYLLDRVPKRAWIGRQRHGVDGPGRHPGNDGSVEAGEPFGQSRQHPDLIGCPGTAARQDDGQGGVGARWNGQVSTPVADGGRWCVALRQTYPGTDVVPRAVTNENAPNPKAGGVAGSDCPRCYNLSVTWIFTSSSGSASSNTTVCFTRRITSFSIGPLPLPFPMLPRR